MTNEDIIFDIKLLVDSLPSNSKSDFIEKWDEVEEHICLLDSEGKKMLLEDEEIKESIWYDSIVRLSTESD